MADNKRLTPVQGIAVCALPFTMIFAMVVLAFTDDPSWALWLAAAASVVGSTAYLVWFLPELLRKPRGVLYRTQNRLLEWNLPAAMGTGSALAHCVAGRRPSLMVPVLVWCAVVGHGPYLYWCVVRRKLPNKGLNIERWTNPELRPKP